MEKVLVSFFLGLQVVVREKRSLGMSIKALPIPGAVAAQLIQLQYSIDLSGFLYNFL